MKKILSLFLLTVLVITAICPTLVSCKNDEAADTDSVSSTGAITEEYDGLEAVDYGGKELVFLTFSQGDIIASENDVLGDFAGGPVERAVYMRNTTMTDKYNVSFNTINVVGNGNVVGEVEKQYLSQNVEIDYVLAGTMNTMTCGINGYTLPVQSIPNIQLDKEWWYSDFLDNTKINGKNFFLIGDFAYTTWMASTCMLYNQTMAENWHIDSEEIFTLIREKKWTIEKLTQYTKRVYVDEGEDGPSLDDTFGFFSNSMCVDAFLAGCDITFIKPDQNGKLKVEVEDRFYDFYTWIYNLAHDETSCYGDATESFGKYNRDTFPPMFEQNQALFMLGGLPDQNSGLRNVGFTYLYLPTPMYNEDQEMYFSWCHQFNSSSVAIINGGKDMDMLGRILEDFTFYSNKTVRPAYYDTLLDGIMANSTTFVEMLDYIVGVYSIDLMSIFANQLPLLSGAGGTLRNSVNKFGNTSVSSMISRQKTSWQKTVDSIVQQVEALP